MKMIVNTAFNLTRDDGTTVRYEVGEQDVPAQDASHWYVLLFATESKKETKGK